MNKILFFIVFLQSIFHLFSMDYEKELRKGLNCQECDTKSFKQKLAVLQNYFYLEEALIEKGVPYTLLKAKLTAIALNWKKLYKEDIRYLNYDETLKLSLNIEPNKSLSIKEKLKPAKDILLYQEYYDELKKSSYEVFSITDFTLKTIQNDKSLLKTPFFKKHFKFFEKSLKILAQNQRTSFYSVSQGLKDIAVEAQYQRDFQVYDYFVNFQKLYLQEKKSRLELWDILEQVKNSLNT